MATTIENVPNYCERCDGESKHLIGVMSAGNSLHYICWACLEREEKRANLRPSWKRARRRN